MTLSQFRFLFFIFYGKRTMSLITKGGGDEGYRHVRALAAGKEIRNKAHAMPT
jgi:hypothetical protein